MAEEKTLAYNNKQGYIHYSFNDKWWNPTRNVINAGISQVLQKVIKDSAKVPESNIRFKNPSGKELSWLNLSAEDLKDASKSLGQIFNQTVRNDLVEGRNRISNNLSIFSEIKKNNETLQKTLGIAELFDGIEQTLHYINAFSNMADAVTWNIFRRELTKNLLTSNSRGAKKREGVENKVDIISKNKLTVINSALSNVMNRLQNLPLNIIKGGGVYSKDSLRTFIGNIVAEEIGEVGIGQWTVEKINEQTNKAMSATFQHTGKQLNNYGKMQKADVVIPLIKSKPFNLSLQKKENGDSGLQLILKGDIGLSVKEYISEEKNSTSGKDFFVNIHAGGSYMKQVKENLGVLSYTALGNTLFFSTQNDDTKSTFRYIRSAFLAKMLETALIGKGKGKADILVVNGKYYFTSVLYKAAIANAIALSQNTNVSQSDFEGSGVKVRFSDIPKRDLEKDWEGVKGQKNITKALIRSSKDHDKLNKLTFSIYINPEKLIENWLK